MVGSRNNDYAFAYGRRDFGLNNENTNTRQSRGPGQPCRGHPNFPARAGSGALRQPLDNLAVRLLCELSALRRADQVARFSAVDELEDVFDAVFEWLRRPSAAALLSQRQKALETEDEDQAE